MLPLAMVPKDFLGQLEKSNDVISGISSVPLHPVGMFTCKVSFGKSYFRNIKVLVVNTNIPPLIGRAILRHRTMKRVTYDDEKSKVVFERSFKNNTSKKLTHEMDLVTMNPNYMGILQTENPKNGLKDKIDWLRLHKQVVLPKHDNAVELEAVADLLVKYGDVFGGEGKPLGKFPQLVSIPTTGQSKHIKQHSIPEAFRSDVDKSIQSMLEQGVIEPCDDPKGFNTPVFAVKKKDGSCRIVANFKNSLNKVLDSTCDMAWQIDSTDDTINSIGQGNHYFSSLDLKAGYWQCEIQTEDRYKTAFQWKGKCYQYVRLPFGMKASGQIFSRCIGKTMEDVSNKENFQTYIDDVLCYGKTFDTYIETLEQILAACLTNGLRLNPVKCSFLKQSAKFLGRIINHEGYQADPDYVQGIRDMPPPTTRKELQAVIGRIVWLRMFIDTRVGERIRQKCFSQLLSELNKLNRRDKVFEWTQEAQTAFEAVKKRLSTMPVIHFADFTKPFTLVTDASQVGVGAVVMQIHNGKQCTVAVASKTLSSVEQRWSASERECYAVVWGIEKFEYFLRGRPFVALTDHKSLTYLDRTNFKNEKISRWQERLTHYDFILEYLEGQENVFADMLSRPNGVKIAERSKDSKVLGKFYTIGKKGLKVYVPSWCADGPLKLVPIGCEETVRYAHCFTAETFGENSEIPPKLTDGLNMFDLQCQDPFLDSVIKCLLDQENGIGEGLLSMDESDHRGVIYKTHSKRFLLDPACKALLYNNTGNLQFVVPPHLYKTMLYRVHDLRGHFAVDRTSEFLRDYWWPGKRSDVKNYCDSCIQCAMKKGPYNKFGKAKTGHLRRGKQPFDDLFCDFVHMKSSSNGKKYIFTVIDSFSRYFFAIATCRDRAIDAAKALVREVLLKFNFIPKNISSDRGTHFTSEVMSQLQKELGVKQHLSTAWHPESNGIVERAHRTMKNALYSTCAEKGCDWATALPYIVNSMNMAKNKSTKCSPYECVFGQKPKFGLPSPTGKDLKSGDPRTYGLNVRLLLENVHESVKTAAEAADLAIESRVKSRKQQRLEVGDEVLIKREHSVVAKETKMPWIGPYKILDTNQHVIRISDGENSDWIHRNHIYKLVERKSKLQNDDDDTPPPIALDSGGFNQPIGKTTDKSAGQNSGGLGVKSPVRPKKSRVKPKPETNTESTSPATPIARRRSARTKEPIQRMQLDHTKGKTYAQVVKSN